jgi:alkyldihydroxyacetonephosphate synthase
MRRWNGWGDEHTPYPLSDSARAYLVERVGAGLQIEDASLKQVLAGIPASRLPENPAVSTEALDRLLHARGQSLPDWVALRSGRIGAFPDGVACPESGLDVRGLLALARLVGAHLIPYGGGTSVVGHINPQPGHTPVLCVDMSRMRSLIALDETSRLATFSAGVSGPQVEQQLRARGYTLGHFPQSFELSTLGGWIATRSSGQQSYHYGRIEDLFAGGHLETPAGPLDLPSLPASAAGPDLRQLVLGCEGRLGVITQATVRIQPSPEYEAFYGAFFHDWASGAAAVRLIVQAGVQVSMLRLSDALETETTLVLSGKDRLVGWAKRGLHLLGYSKDMSLLIYAVTGTRRSARRALALANEAIRANGGLPTGETIGKQWQKSRFLAPYLRNTLWGYGYALDTVETAVPWSAVLALAADIQKAIHGALRLVDERGLVFTHLSHVYPDGASIYTTFLFRRAADPDETLARWQAIKAAVSQAILANGGTISHQHGVGLDHAPYLSAEKGSLGMEISESVCRTLDPTGMMNPGKLFWK